MEYHVYPRYEDHITHREVLHALHCNFPLLLMYSESSNAHPYRVIPFVLFFMSNVKISLVAFHKAVSIHP